MSGTRVNQLVAAAIAFVNSIIPVLILTGAISLSSDATAAIYLAVSNFGTLVGLIFAQSSSTNT